MSGDLLRHGSREIYKEGFFFSLAKVAELLDLRDPIDRGVNPSTCIGGSLKSEFA